MMDRPCHSSVPNSSERSWWSPYNLIESFGRPEPGRASSDDQNIYRTVLRVSMSLLQFQDPDIHIRLAHCLPMIQLWLQVLLEGAKVASFLLSKNSVGGGGFEVGSVNSE